MAISKVISPSGIKQLEVLAARECWYSQEDFTPIDYAGGNFDDCYWGGYDDGQAALARKILSEISG